MMEPSLSPEAWTIESGEATSHYLRSIFGFILSDLLAQPPEKAARALADPRALHRNAYAPLTPPDHPEFAGNFRGADFPSLRTAYVSSAFDAREGAGILAPPEDIEKLMRDYAAAVLAVSRAVPATPREALRLYGRLTIALGVIHPFLDGNGHIQRLTLQWLLQKAGFRMAPAWSIHPCPYGETVHRALAGGQLDVLVDSLEIFVADAVRGSPGPAR